MILLRYLFLLILLVSCSNQATYNYSIESDAPSEDINTRLVFNIFEKNSNDFEFEIQAFPKETNNIKNYEIVFDMKFRENYGDEFNGVCIGPNWEEFGPGEFTMILDQKNNFKSSINAKIISESDDRCNNYYFYARFLNINMQDGSTYLVGVATDYAGKYPDAPSIWKQNTSNEIELIFTSNIERYSINFELSK